VRTEALIRDGDAVDAGGRLPAVQARPLRSFPSERCTQPLLSASRVSRLCSHRMSAPSEQRQHARSARGVSALPSTRRSPRCALVMQAVIDGIDARCEVPVGTAPHAAAAALLAYFKALPRPFFPESVSTVRARADPGCLSAACSRCLGPVHVAARCCGACVRSERAQGTIH
jgi:hypothetical protein